MKRFVTIRKLFGLPYLPLILAPLVLLGPIWLGGKALFWGTPASQFLPWWQWAFETILDGHLPLWNPLVGMGAPLIGNYQSALFYPPNWVYFGAYVLGGLPAMAWMQALVVVAHLVLAGVGMARLTQRLGMGELAQAVSGLAFSLSGYLVARAWFASINTAVAWLPWALVFGYDLAVRDDKGRAWQQLSLVLGMQLLAGHAQTSWYTWLLLGVWVGYWRWVRQGFNNNGRKAGLGVIQEWGRMAGAIFMAGGLAMVQLAPTAVYLSQSQRASAAEYEAAMTYSFWPWRFLGLVAPNLFGNPAHQDYWGYGNYWEDAIYIGLLPLLLALGAIWRMMWRKRREAGPAGGQGNPPRSLGILLVGVVAVGVILALGKNTPVFPWLYRNVPTFDMFQSPTRFSIWLVTALAILAGMGAEGWRAPQGRRLYWTRLGTAGALAVTLAAVAGGIALQRLGTDIKVTFIPAMALTGIWGLGSGILSLVAPGEGDEGVRRRRLWGWAVVLWVGIDLVVAGWGLNPGIDLDFYRSQAANSEEMHARVGEGRLYLLQDDEYKLKYKRYFTFEGFEPGMGWENLRASYLPNMNMLDGVPVVNNYDPLVPRRYADWMAMVDALQVRVRPDLLDVMGISVLSWADDKAPYGMAFVDVEGSQRVRWVPCAVTVADEAQALALLRRKQVHVGEVVVLEDGVVEDWGELNGLPIRCTGDDVDFDWMGEAVMVESGNPNEVVIRTQADQSGWVVLGDSWYPGWRAWVDGERTAIQHGDYAFRAVAVLAGEHRVRFAYQPVWFYAGLGVSLVCLLALVGMRVRIKR